MQNYARTAALLSIFMGLGQLYNRQLGKAVFFFTLNLIAILYLLPQVYDGISGLITLGEIQRIPGKVEGDNSQELMINGVVITGLFVVYLIVVYLNILDAYKTGRTRDLYDTVPTFSETFKRVTTQGFPFFLLALPLFGVFVFTVLPLIFMILLSFTNWGTKGHEPPGNLVDWVAFEQFEKLLVLEGMSFTFYNVLAWTLVWAVIATVTTYFGGMLVALLVNQDSIKFKSLWRTIFILPFAIPQLVSLLIMRNLFSEKYGPVNEMIRKVEEFMNNTFGTSFNLDWNIPWLADMWMAKVTVILVNMWIGIPVSMVLILGILTTIPKDLYEAADVDGATGFQKFKFITLPWILIQTGPLLIMQFVGNINNFGIIYLLTGGGPNVGRLGSAGETDILITWLYNMTLTGGNVGLASAIGVVLFIFMASFGIYQYRRSKAFLEEDLIS